MIIHSINIICVWQLASLSEKVSKKKIVTYHYACDHWHDRDTMICEFVQVYVRACVCECVGSPPSSASFVGAPPTHTL